MSYEAYKKALQDVTLPAAIVDVAAFDRNLKKVAQLAGTKKVRIASKSLRVPALIERVLAHGPPFSGVMTFAAAEAEALALPAGHDVLLAYPAVQAADVACLARAAEKKTVHAVVDSVEGIAALRGTNVGVVIELDMALRPGAGLHLGVRRSPVRTVEQVLALVEETQKHKLRFSGFMGYEAQVAGLPDRLPGAALNQLMNAGKQWVRKRSVADARSRRAALVDELKKRGVSFSLFNGGGSMSLDTTTTEACITEVTAGSAFFSPHLFDHYSNLAFEPAAFFALPVVRVPAPGFVTCAGGGYVASGSPGFDKVPVPWLPPGLALLKDEACGEVQTPLTGPAASSLRIGDAVFFRHAKAGELFERFAEVVLVDGDSNSTITRVPTYRGNGWCFP